MTSYTLQDLPETNYEADAQARAAIHAEHFAIAVSTLSYRSQICVLLDEEVINAPSTPQRY